jgi:hypothetical protein
MTSPAGAGDGAFVVQGERVRGLRGEGGAAGASSRAAHTVGDADAPGEPMSYESLRRAVRAELGR